MYTSGKRKREESRNEIGRVQVSRRCYTKEHKTGGCCCRRDRGKKSRARLQKTQTGIHRRGHSLVINYDKRNTAPPWAMGRRLACQSLVDADRVSLARPLFSLHSHTGMSGRVARHSESGPSHTASTPAATPFPASRCQQVPTPFIGQRHSLLPFQMLPCWVEISVLAPGPFFSTGGGWVSITWQETTFVVVSCPLMLAEMARHAPRHQASIRAKSHHSHFGPDHLDRRDPSPTHLASTPTSS